MFLQDQHYNLYSTDFERISINNRDNNFSVGLNHRAAINLNKFALDLRYEGGFNENEATF